MRNGKIFNFMQDKFKSTLLNIVLLLFLFSFEFSSYSQSDSRDSIECDILLSKANATFFSNSDSAYDLSSRAESIALKGNFKSLLAKSYIYMSKSLLLQSNLEEAEVVLNKGIGLYKDMNDEIGTASAYKLKSILVKRLGNFKESTELSELALRIFRKCKNEHGILSTLMNLSIDYIEANQLQKAEEVLNETATLTENFSSSNLYFYYQNWGKLKLAQKKEKEAITWFTKALNFATENEMVDSKATALMNLGLAYRENKQIPEAVGSLLESKLYSDQNHLVLEESEACNALVKMYEDQKDYQNAFNMLKQYNHLKEKILTTEKIKNINMLEKKLALSEKEKEIEEQKIKNQEAKKRNKQLIYLASVIGLIAIFALFMFLRARMLHKRITQQNRKLEIKNKIIFEKQKEIIDSLHYAQRIQNSLLPSDKFLKKCMTKLRRI